MGERGVAVDHTTLYRWVQRYAPELEKRTLWYQNRLSFSWRVGETSGVAMRFPRVHRIRWDRHRANGTEIIFRGKGETLYADHSNCLWPRHPRVRRAAGLAQQPGTAVEAGPC